MKKFLQNIEYSILGVLIIIFPFFFLNFTQEYFITNKLYLLSFGVLLLLLISIVQILIYRKISWEKRVFDNFIMLFLTTTAISVVFSSPNKIQALLNPNFGLVMMISLATLYFYLSRQKGPSSSYEVGPYIKIVSTILSLITIVFFFQPFKNITLPQNFAFLKNPSFTPVGSQLDLTVLLGFFVVFQVSQLIKTKRSSDETMEQLALNYSFLIISLLAIFLTIYSLIKGQVLQLPPFRLSWFAALEILKNPQTAIFGIGLDNFSSIFTRVKDFAYNQSPLWQINSFNISRSAILQIFTETGILGLLAFGLMVFSSFKFVLKQWSNETIKPFIYSFVYLLICLFILPTSLFIWFLFFMVLGLISQQSNNQTMKQSMDLLDILPIYIGIIVISIGLIGTSGYFLGRAYASEYYFKKSIDGVANDKIKEVYDNQRQAIIINPYIERFRSNFAQTNLLIANNLAKKKSGTITDQDKQTITQAIQASIAEGKAVVALNPQRADGWQNLATIYLNIINAATGADVWTISAYQRAILADPQNPTYRVGIGGVYYSLKKYDDALKFFEQAISLKPDWPNANYNYAWANFQKENYPQAVNALQNTLNLLDPQTNKADYTRVQKELEEFKKKLPKEEATTNKQGQKKTESGSLNLPTPPATSINPKLELPKEASPEAR